MARYRIVSFDGGGILGAIGARLIERLFEEVPSLLARVDLYAGTSVGAISAAALAVGLSPRELMLLYRPPLIAGAFLPYPTLDRRARGETLPLHLDPASVLQELLRVDVPLSKLERHVFLPTFDLGSESGQWGPVFQHNLAGSTTADVSLVDAVLRSAACPIYWPSQSGFVDGWMVANNPCLAAALAATSHDRGRCPITDLRLLSLGVGRPRRTLAGGDLAWGRRQWFGADPNGSSLVAGPLLDMLFTCASAVPALQAAQLLGTHFFRLDPILPRPVPMNDPAHIGSLIELVDELDLGPCLDWIRANWL